MTRTRRNAHTKHKGGRRRRNAHTKHKGGGSCGDKKSMAGGRRRRTRRNAHTKHKGGRRRTYGLVLKDLAVPAFYVVLNSKYKTMGALRRTLNKVGIGYRPVKSFRKSAFRKRRRRRRRTRRR